MEELRGRVEAEMASGGRWLVGVSGGGDSVALLRLLISFGFAEQVVVGHFNHRWSEWGDEAEAFVVELGKHLKIDVELGVGRGKAATNAEAVAREERREWMFGKCREMGLKGLILAHSRTDVVEGFLMRAGKGSGVRGLAGMREFEDGGIALWRPLLGVGREALRDYLADIGQKWLEDPDNERGGSQRSKVRKLLPLLENVGIGEEAVAASVAALGRAEEALEVMTERFCAVHVIENNGFSVDREALLVEPLEVQVRVLERVLRVGDEMVARTSKRLSLLGIIAAQEQGTATLGGMKFVWEPACVRALKLKGK